jgi:hypothetical protein
MGGLERWKPTGRTDLYDGKQLENTTAPAPSRRTRPCAEVTRVTVMELNQIIPARIYRGSDSNYQSTCR